MGFGAVLGGGLRSRHGQFSILCDDVVELCAQGRGRFGKGSPMFFVVLCDDVVRKLFVSGKDEVSLIE